MRRRREVAAAPARSAGDAWGVVAGLLRDALTRSDKVDAEEVEAALDAARPAGLGLIAGGHLDRHPLVLVGAPLHLSVTTVSGDKALVLEENLDVPGGAAVSEWTLYLPSPEPLTSLVESAAAKHERLSTDEPPADAESAAEAKAAIDRDALARRGPES
jgi:hypothetical protein